MGPLEAHDRIGELGVTTAQRVDRLYVCKVEPFGDLCRSYEVVHVDLPSHRWNATRSLLTLFVVTLQIVDPRRSANLVAFHLADGL